MTNKLEISTLNQPVTFSVCDMVGHRYGFDYPTGEYINGYPVYANTCQKCGDTQRFQSYTSSTLQT